MLTFSALFVKMKKIEALIHGAKTIQVPDVPLRNMLLGVFSLVALDVIIMAMWQSNAPLNFVRIVSVVSLRNEPLVSRGTCWSNTSEWYPYSIVIAALHASVLVYGCRLAYRIRMVATFLAETKYVCIAMISNLQVLALGIPVLGIASTQPTSRYFAAAGIIFLNDFTILNLIFIPKIYARMRRTESFFVKTATREYFIPLDRQTFSVSAVAHFNVYSVLEQNL